MINATPDHKLFIYFLLQYHLVSNAYSTIAKWFCFLRDSHTCMHKKQEKKEKKKTYVCQPIENIFRTIYFYLNLINPFSFTLFSFHLYLKISLRYIYAYHIKGYHLKLEKFYLISLRLFNFCFCFSRIACKQSRFEEFEPSLNFYIIKDRIENQKRKKTKTYSYSYCFKLAT